MNLTNLRQLNTVEEYAAAIISQNPFFQKIKRGLEKCENFHIIKFVSIAKNAKIKRKNWQNV